MKPIARLKEGLKKLKPLLSKARKPKSPKPVKKNTWRRRLKAWGLRLDRRQQQRTGVNVVKDDTVRICSNCGCEYSGRYCPQCGQAGTWKRYSWRQAMLNFLDIWGLGNRPMFRTLKELFWRPGYMVRDYLSGHRQFYFPPFKLLAVSLVLMLFVSWITGVKYDSIFDGITEDKVNSIVVTDVWTMLTYWLGKFAVFLSGNLLYRWLILGVVAVIFIRVAFRHVGRYNLVETYIFLVFVLAQMSLCNVPGMLCEGFCNFLMAHSLPVGATSSSTLLSGCASLVVMLVNVLVGIFHLLVFVLLLMDFRQFYGLSWKSTIWHLLLSVLLLSAILAEIASITGIFVSDTKLQSFYAALVIFLIILSFYLADVCLTRNKSLINRDVTWITKISMLSVFVSPGFIVALFNANYNMLSAITFIVLFFMIAVFLSIAPIYIYKKFHRTWLSLLPTLLLIVFMAIVVELC